MPINNGGGGGGITIELDPNSLPFTGGTLTGTLYVPEIRNILNENLIIDAYNDNGAGTHNLFKFNPFGGGLELPTGSAGIKFGDATIQTTAGVTLDAYEGGINFQATNIYGGFRVYKTRNDGDGDYLAVGQFNTYGFNLVSEGNPAGDWSYGQKEDGVHFYDGSIQTTAALPLHSSTNQIITSDGAGSGDTIFRNYVAINSESGYLDIQKEFNVGARFLVSDFEYGGFVSRFEITPYEIIFPDSTTQTTAALPLTGGTVTGAVELTGYTEFRGVSVLFDGTDVTFSGSPVRFNNGDGEIFISGSGILFANGTNQTTAGLPLAGGTLTGKLNLNVEGTTTAPLNIKTGISPTTPLVGDVWITSDSFNYRNTSGVTRTVATLGNNNPFTNYQSISVSNNSNPALKITQLGTGEALRVEDETSPDATAFVVSNNGRVGIGVAPHATAALSIDGTGIKFTNVLVVPDRVITTPVGAVYAHELLLTINGVNYAIPLRVV